MTAGDTPEARGEHGGHDVWGVDFGQVGWHQPEAAAPVAAVLDRARTAPAVPAGASPEPAADEPGADATEPPEPVVSEPHADLLETAYGIIANAGWDAFSGNVDLPKTAGWHEAAVRWRDDYHRWLDLHLRPGGYQSWEELAAGLVRERDALAFEVTKLRSALRDAASAQPLAVKADEEARDD